MKYYGIPKNFIEKKNPIIITGLHTRYGFNLHDILRLGFATF